MKICPECLERVDEEYEHCPDDGTELREIHARDEDPMEGRILDEKWVLESRIGGGGMGTVYRAHQLSVDREVAVKVLRSALVEDDEHVERFFREANVASNIHDSRCVTIYDFGQTADDHVLYLAMEYLEGMSLQDQIKERMLTFEETLRVGIQVCEALSVLHDEGVVHRDLKPENVFLVDEIGEDLFLKLLDFGLAKLAHSDETPVTATGKIFGTPTFMSPEQCMGSEVGYASDLYALGCLLFQLVTGRTPFEGSSSVQILLGHVNRRPPPLTGRVTVPTAFEELVDELLSKDPAERPSSAGEVKKRLNDILQRITAATAAQTPIPASESEDRASPVAETLPGGEPQRELESEASAEDGGFDRTQGGVAPVYELSEEKEETDGEGDEVPETEVHRGRPDDAGETPGNAVVRIAAAATVFVGGLAVMWTVMEPSAPRASDITGTSRATATRAAGGVVLPPASRALHEGARRTATVVSWVPDAVALGVAGGASLIEATAVEQTGEASAPAGVGKETGGSGDGGSDGTQGESGDPMLPVLTKSAATQVFRSKSGVIETCFEKGAGRPDFDGGKIRLRLVIGETGAVSDASIASSTVEEASVRNCAIAEAKSWTFPAPPEGNTAVLLHEYEFGWKTLK